MMSRGVAGKLISFSMDVLVEFSLKAEHKNILTLKLCQNPIQT